MTRFAMLSVLTALLATSVQAQQYAWAPSDPGSAQIISTDAQATVENSALRVSLVGKNLSAADKWGGTTKNLGAGLVRLVTRSGKIVEVEGGRVREPMMLAKNALASKASDRVGGKAIAIGFTVPSLSLQGYWRILLRDDTNYARIEVGLKAIGKDVDISDIDLLSFPTATAKVVGKTQGSPIVDGNFFFGVEHPMSESKVENGEATCSIHRVLPIKEGTTVVYSAVIGVAPEGQMRRGFLAYVESMRAHPYRPFLHYNSWYDIGYGNTYTADECVDRINKFGTELVQKRGVKMDSFLFDDGWDDYDSIWKFNKGFPNGFLPLKAAAEKYGADPGVWLSPWGGYGDAREERLKYGKAHGMEVDSQGYALSGPKYYKLFHQVTLDFVTRQGINQFKFDGTGSPDKTTPGSQFDSDFDAAISLIGDLRKARPDLFVNLTTGTWPSPFWLRYADTTWRGGMDNGLSGVGDYRERYITYRDGDTYHGVVLRGPLYPLNSLMVHGVIYAQHGPNLNTDPNNEFGQDIHDFFGNGTQLQELYITPDLLTQQNWDDLAEVAKWSRANADTLVDTHWVGGDPTKVEVYGWASWSPRKGILVLRNPSDKPQAFSVDIASVLQLPHGFAKSYEGHSPWKADAGQAAIEFPVGGSKVIDLKPFEVLTLDLEAKK